MPGLYPLYCLYPRWFVQEQFVFLHGHLVCRKRDCCFVLEAAPLEKQTIQGCLSQTIEAKDACHKHSRMPVTKDLRMPATNNLRMPATNI